LVFLDLSFCNLSSVPDAIGKLRYLERLNLEGNDLVSLPSSVIRFSSLAYLNLAHCERLQSLPDLLFCATSSSGGRYFKMVSRSHNHRSGLYIFNCPLLQIAEGDHNYLALSWLMKLVEVHTSHLLPNPLSPVLFFSSSDFFYFLSLVPESLSFPVWP